MPLEKGRRSSILKPSKVRNPLGELDQLRPADNYDDDAPTATEITRNRRVSFSHKKGVALFTSEEGNTIWHNIYEEHNKPDLSDSGGGSRLHISVEDDKPEVKQEPSKSNMGFPTFNTEVDDEDEHCVDIQAMLTGIKPRPERELPNLVLELTQPSISDKTDILINYKIPHEDGASITETRIKTEEPPYETKILGDMLCDESQAEMSITQDVPIVIVTNNVKSEEEINRCAFDISILEDKVKWVEGKENIVMQRSLDNIDDPDADLEEVEIKEEMYTKNESIHIVDMHYPGAKRSMVDMYLQDIPDKKVKTEGYNPNTSDGDMSFTKALDDNLLEDLKREKDCEDSIAYCFTKEVKMNNKRETIGYNVKRSDISMPCANEDEDCDPFADIKTANMSIKSYRPSEIAMNDSLENAVDVSLNNDRNFEFVECDNVNNSMKGEDLNTSDVLNVKQDDSFGADLVKGDERITSENKENMVFRKDTKQFKKSEDVINKPDRKTIIFDTDGDTCNMSVTNIVQSKGVMNNGRASTGVESNRKTLLFNEDQVDCNMSMTDIVSAMKLSLDRGECDNKVISKEIIQKKPELNESNKENIHYVPTANTMDDKMKTIVFDPNASDCNMSMTSAYPKETENYKGDNRKTIVFDPNSSDCNMSMTSAYPKETENYRGDNRKTIVFNPNSSDCNMSMTSAYPKETENYKGDNRKTIVFDPNSSDCNMSMTSAYPKETENYRGDNRKTIVFNPNSSDCNMSMTSAYPKETENYKGDNRKTIVFDPNSSDCNMSMTSAYPKETENYRGDNRKTIVFNCDASEANMSVTTAVSGTNAVNNRTTVHCNPNNSDCDMSMTNIYHIKNIDANTSNKKDIVFEHMPVGDVSITGVFPLEEVEEKHIDKRKTILFDPDMPDSNISMTCALPARSAKDMEQNNITRYNVSKMECDMSLTKGVPLHAQLEKRKTILFDPNSSDCDMSMTSAAPVMGTSILGKEDEPFYDVTMKTVTYDNNPEATTKRKTILFNQDEKDANMSMTNVYKPIQRGECMADIENRIPNSHIEKENLKDGDILKSTGLRRQTILFDRDNIESNMSMTSGISIQKLHNVEYCDDEYVAEKVSMKKVGKESNRKTIVFNEGMPEFDMSMTNMMQRNTNPGAEKRKIILFNQDMPDCNMSMTSVIPINANDNRKTILFNKDASDGDMSMTSIAPVDICDNKTNDKRRTIHYNQDKSDCDMSMTNVMTGKKCDDKKQNKRESVYNQEMPDYDMSITGVAPLESIGAQKQENKRKTIHFNQEMPEIDMSMTGVVPLKSIGDEKQDNKKKTIHFDQDIPEFEMSMTGVIPLKPVCDKKEENKRKTIHFNHEMPEFDMSMTGVVHLKSVCDQKEKNKRKTLHFDQDMPEISERDTTITNIATEKSCEDKQNEKKNVINNHSLPKCGAPVNSQNTTKEISVSNNISGAQTSVPSIKSPLLIENDGKVNDFVSSQSSDKVSGLYDNKKESRNILDATSACNNIQVPGFIEENITAKINYENNDVSVCGVQENKSVNEKDNLLNNLFMKPNSDVSNKSQIVITANDHLNCTNDKYFEQACKSFLSGSKMVDRSCLSISSIMPRIDPVTNYNMTMNSVSSYMPNMDESKSVLFDNNVPNNKIMEVSKCFEGYRDPCKSANNSLFGVDKSNLSLPNIDDSVVEDQIMSESITPRIQPGEQNVNTATNSFASLTADFGEKSVFHDKSFFENKMQMTCNLSLKPNTSIMMNINENKSFFDMSLPKINEKLMMDKSETNKNNDEDFHMSVDEINIQVESDVAVNITSDKANCKSHSMNVSKVEIATEEQVQFNEIISCDKTSKSVANVLINMDVEENSVVPNDTHVDKNMTGECYESVKIGTLPNVKRNITEIKIDQCEPLQVLGEQVPVINTSEIVGDIKENHDVLNFEHKDIPIVENLNIVYKNNISSVTEKNVNIEMKTPENKLCVEDDMKKTREKRRSDNDTDVESLKYSLPKKQKIIVPEVCSWLKEVSIVKSAHNSISIQQEKAETIENRFSSKEQLDSHTYTISREQLESFANIQELNDNVHKKLNDSDHFIENVSMCLVDSSLDKSGECKNCGDNINIQGIAGEINCVNCKDANMKLDVKSEMNISTTHSGGAKISLCESIRISTGTENSPVKFPERSPIKTEASPTKLREKSPIDYKTNVEAPRVTLKQLVDKCASNLAMCEVSYEPSEIVFTLMRRHIKLRVLLGTELSEDSDHLTPVFDIVLEQKTVSSTNTLSNLESIAARMAVFELSAGSLKAVCVMGGDIPKVVTKCCQVVKTACSWSRQCFMLYVKYNLRLIDERMWTFEICDGYHMCAWDVEIRLQNKKVVHYTKPQNIRIKTAIGQCTISDSAFNEVIESIQPGWTFLPDLISGIHDLIRRSRKI